MVAGQFSIARESIGSASTIAVGSLDVAANTVSTTGTIPKQSRNLPQNPTRIPTVTNQRKSVTSTEPAAQHSLQEKASNQLDIQQEHEQQMQALDAKFERMLQLQDANNSLVLPDRRLDPLENIFSENRR